MESLAIQVPLPLHSYFLHGLCGPATAEPKGEVTAVLIPTHRQETK